MIIDEAVYLEHHGVKGMQWGVRKQQVGTAAKAVGRGTEVVGKVAWKGTKAVGRGTKKAAIWAKNNPKQAAAIAAGVVAVGLILNNAANRNVTIRSAKIRSRDYRASKRMLEAHKEVKLLANKGMINRYAPGSVIRNLAEQQTSVINKDHAKALSDLARQSGRRFLK